MIILTAGHTGPNSGAQCATTQFDEGAENIWLRNRIAEILTNDYGLVVLVDDDTASLKLLLKNLQTPKVGTQHAASDGSQETNTIQAYHRSDDRADARAVRPYSCPSIQTGRQDDKKNHVLMSSCQKTVDCRPLTSCDKRVQRSSLLLPSEARNLSEAINVDFLIDIHFNAHSNPQARGAETIVADDATTLELRFASRLAHATSDALDIPLRSIKSESETPHRRLGMLHLTPQSIILEVCFCTSPEDVEAYRKNREKLAEDLAWAIYELL